MTERNARERKGITFYRHYVFPTARGYCNGKAIIRHKNDLLNRRHRLYQVAHNVALIERLSAIRVMIDRNQNFGADLRKSVDHRICTEIGRATRPDGSQ